MNKFSLGGALIIVCVLSSSLPELTQAQSSAVTNQAAVVPPQSGPMQSGAGQTNRDQARPRPRERFGRNGGGDLAPTLGLEQGFLELNTPDFNLKLVKASQTVAALQPKGADGFDFTPADQLTRRAGNQFFQLGDLTLRLREGHAGEWRSYSTAAERKPVSALPASGDTLAAADLAATLPADCPLQVTRSWALDQGKLVLQFELKNKSDQPVEIGSLGIPLIFNNFITGRSLADAHAVCSFSDPAICQDAGYVQVTRLNGHGPALVVVPEGRTPLEAYNPVLNPRDELSAATQVFADRTPRSQTFEGFYEWMPLSLAYAENEWKNAQPWNPPTSETLAPGATRTFGLKFLAAPEIPDIEKTLADNNRPVAVGIPGFILPMDVNGRLFLKYAKEVKSVEVEPAGAMAVTRDSSTGHGWQAYTLRGRDWGRARLTITYGDGLVQTIGYNMIKPEAQAVADLGHFLFTKQWFDDPGDPFHRSPSVMTYDRARNRIVTQDARAWIAGLEDEGGAGSWLAAAMKEFGQPQKDEVEKFQQFVDGVLWGGIQYTNGPWKYGVRKSLFYYDTNAFPNYYDPEVHYGGWTSWNKRDAERVDRAYNYPHVVAAYWAMYRLARNNHGLVTNHPWEWYLDHAYQTVKFLTGRNANGRYNVGYLNTGLMEGDIFLLLLKDMQREGWNQQAAELEAAMKARADRWNREAFPFGSEMAWDSTGQEEVYAWCDYFGYADKALVTLDSILGYMPTVPNWGYNGNARRYWDFYYGAAPGGRLERQIHHYGSGINAIPVLTAYRQKPDDYYLLRVGYAGTVAPLANIDQDGFAAAAFHSAPWLMKWDAYSGDYGPNFFGHALDTATYVVHHPEFGWLAFGGNVVAATPSSPSARVGDGGVAATTVEIQPLDSFRHRVYLAPLGLWLTLEAGTFDRVEMNTKTHAVRVGLSAATPFVSEARLCLEQPAKLPGIGAYQPAAKLTTERGASVVPLKEQAVTWVEFTEAK